MRPTIGAVTELAGGLRVVMIVIDAMPHRHVSAGLTPNLWRQSATGGRAPMGGLSLPMSVTYANHAAFITGVDPAITGVHGNHTWIDDRGWVPAPKEGPRTTTLFERVGVAGGRSAMVAGDQKLVGQMGGMRADAVWPPMAGCPTAPTAAASGTHRMRRCSRPWASIDLDVDFVVIHLNEPDTTSHLYGPDSPEAMEQYRSTDAAYGEVIARFTEGWDDTIVLTLSDHDQETITDGELVDLGAALRAVDGVDVADEGTAALVHVAPDASAPADDQLLEMIRAVPGVEATAPWHRTCG